MLDPTGIVSSWNPGAQRFKGYAESEILGEHFSRFYTEEDRATGLPQRALETAAREGKFEAEGWRVRKDGTRFWAHVVIDPIRDPHGNLIGFAKITRDLTERRKAQEALRESEERFRLLVQGVTDYAIYMLDPQGHVTNWNAGAQRIKGYADDEIVGQHFSHFYTRGGSRQRPAAARARDGAREGRFEAEGWRVRKDGTRFWASVVIDPIYDDSGEPDRLCQDHPRHHRAPEGAGGPGTGAGRPVPVPEDGGRRPAHGRHRPRLQQPADDHRQQSRSADPQRARSPRRQADRERAARGRARARS